MSVIYDRCDKKRKINEVSQGCVYYALLRCRSIWKIIASQLCKRKLVMQVPRKGE